MIDKLELLAIKSVALKDPEYFQRRICRYYSEKFHTPLMEVYSLPWSFVFTNYIEHLIETNNDKESVYNLAIDICYPEKREEEEQEIEDWIKDIEAKEEAKREARKKKMEENKAAKENKEEPGEKNPHIDDEEIHMGENLFSHLEEDMGENDG
jgi:hypothetical protein